MDLRAEGEKFDIAGSICLTILPIWLIQSIMFCCSVQSLCSNHSMWPVWTIMFLKSRWYTSIFDGLVFRCSNTYRGELDVESVIQSVTNTFHLHTIYNSPAHPTLWQEMPAKVLTCEMINVIVKRSSSWLSKCKQIIPTETLPHATSTLGTYQTQQPLQTIVTTHLSSASPLLQESLTVSIATRISERCKMK